MISLIYFDTVQNENLAILIQKQVVILNRFV